MLRQGIWEIWDLGLDVQMVNHSLLSYGPWPVRNMALTCWALAVLFIGTPKNYAKVAQERYANTHTDLNLRNIQALFFVIWFI